MLLPKKTRRAGQAEIPSQLIVLHIPKTAGTTIRTILQSIYGQECMFWFGRDGDPRSFKQSAETRGLIIGGHRELKFYPAGKGSLYVATLREPTSRIASLFSYITRPDEASNEHGRTKRQMQYNDWIKEGIRPDSIVQSLKRCRTFREQVENYQCAYLSRGRPSFSATIKTLRKENFLLGTTTGLEDLFMTLADMFNWPEFELINANVSLNPGKSEILDEPGAIDLIQELTEEDQKLWEFVSEEHRGLYSSCPPSGNMVTSPLYFDPEKNREISRAAWKKVTVRASDSTQVLHADTPNQIQVKVTNCSREPLIQDETRGLFFAYRLLDSTGEVINHECPRTRVDTDVPANGTHTQVLSIIIPEKFREKTRAIKLGLLYHGRFWVDTLHESHAQIIPVTLLSQPDCRADPLGNTHT